MAKDNKENINRGQKIILGLAIFFLFFHLINIFLANFHHSFIPEKITKYAHIYSEPFWGQKWDMFVPAPYESNAIQFRLNYADSVSNWIYPYQKEIEMHHSIPFLHYDDLAIGIYNILYMSRMDLYRIGFPENKIVSASHFEPLKKSHAQFLLQKFIIGYLKRNKIDSPESVDIHLTYDNHKANTQIIYQIHSFTW